MKSLSVKYRPLKRLKMGLLSGKRSRSSITLGVITTFLAALSFTFMSACARCLSAMPSGELTLFRGVVGLFFIPLLCLQTKERFYTGKYRFLLSLRGLFGAAALFFYFFSIEGLTLGDAQILSQLAAFFMCILSPLFLKEKLPKEALPGMLAIVLGTALVIRIWNFHSFNVYSLYGIGGGFFSAAAYIVISYLAEKGFRSNTEIVFYFQIFSMVVGLAMGAGEIWILPVGWDFLFIVGLGFFALAAQMFMTWAFQHVNSLVVSFLMYSEILFHVLFGWMFWDEVLPLSSWAGGAFIAAGSIMLLVFKPRGIHEDTHHHTGMEKV